MRIRLVAAALLIVVTSAAYAQSPDDLASKIVNDPAAPVVNGAKAALRDDAAVQGGKALRIQVPRRGSNVWDTALESPVTKAIKRGDEIVLAFMARLEKGEGGAASATLPFAGVQLAAAPYTPILQQPVQVGPEWKMVEIRGKADRNYSPGELKVSVHLATGKQVIDVGPVIVLDLGPAS